MLNNSAGLSAVYHMGEMHGCRDEALNILFRGEAASRMYPDRLSFFFKIGDAVGIPEIGFFFIAIESWNGAMSLCWIFWSFVC